MKKITKENFITDLDVDKVYYSSLIDKVSGDLDEKARSGLIPALKSLAPKAEALYNTMDVWARDYMPIQLTKDVFLSYHYHPDYLEKDRKCETDWQRHNVHTSEQVSKNKHWWFKVVELPIILDGGNVIKAVAGGRPYMIMCNKVLIENNIDELTFRVWWDKWWKQHFDGTEMGLVLLPWEGSKDNPIGHADGMVRYIGEDRVLLTNYIDYDEKQAAEMKKRLEKAGFEVRQLSYKGKFDYDTDKEYSSLYDESWSYINFLQLGHRVLLPRLCYDALNKEAERQIKNAFGPDFDIQMIDVDMTPIIRATDTMNSGGALNCLTWTVKQ